MLMIKVNKNIVIEDSVALKDLPTKDGTIIEKGSNANGDYIKYENGLMICYKTIWGTANISTAWGALFTSADVDLGNTPQNFTSRPTIIVSPQTQSGTQYFITGSSGGSYGGYNHFGGICFIRPNSRTGVAYILDVLAIGNWK